MEIKIAMSVPTVMAMGALVASSDLIATISSYTATELARFYKLDQHPLPFRMPPLAFYLLWHARFDDDRAHRWLRDTVKGLSMKADAYVERNQSANN